MKKKNAPLLYKIMTGVKVATVMCATTALATQVSALAWYKKDIPITSADGADVANGIVATLTKIAVYIGGGLIVHGIYEISMAYTQSSAESKVRGIATALAGVALICMDGIVTYIATGS